MEININNKNERETSHQGEASRVDPQQIRKMFASIASRYDMTNTFLSASLHHVWRKQVVEWSELERLKLNSQNLYTQTYPDAQAQTQTQTQTQVQAQKTQRNSNVRVLDTATGTGDLAIAYQKALGISGEVIGTDFCPEMLGPADSKALSKLGSTLADRMKFQEADVLQLPFASNSFDLASISFGLRNVASPVRALAELGRVTRPGGLVMVLEFGQPGHTQGHSSSTNAHHHNDCPEFSNNRSITDNDSKGTQENLLGPHRKAGSSSIVRQISRDFSHKISSAFAPVYHLYSEYILPHVGGVLTGNREAYRYLQTSSANFPCGEELARLVHTSPLSELFETEVEWKPVSLGIAYIYKWRRKGARKGARP